MQGAVWAALFGVLVAAGFVFSTVRADAGQKIRVVGVENEYADVISEIGGRYVEAEAIVTDPNTDPHSFEVSPRVAAAFANADLVVENGLGYDSWADKILSAAPKPGRKIINVQKLLGRPESTPNPHLWYDPATMPAVARTVAEDLAALQPEHAAYFRAKLARFEDSLKPWLAAIASFKACCAGVPVAVTEPVADDLLDAVGAKILTPFSLQAAIMNGTDPAPQDVAKEQALLRGHEVKALIYNRQVIDPLTQSFLALARQSGVPVVGVYETIPSPGYDYASWMLAEVAALRSAVEDKKSTATLLPKAAR